MERNIMFVAFILVFVLILWIGVFTGVAFLKKTGVLQNDSLIRWIYLFAVIIPLVMAITMVVGNSGWSSLNAFLYTISSSWIVIVSGFFFSTILFWALSLGATALNLNSNISYAGYGALMFTILFTCYGILNASNIKTKFVQLPEDTFISEELQDKKIALVSDLHVGLVRQKRFVEKVTKKIMEQNPDMILIAGDLIDGPSFPYEDFLSPLADLSAQFGVYFTPGNHEGYNQENELFYAALPDNITVITDTTIQIPGTSQTIAGFDYSLESKDLFKDKVGKILDNESPSIAILHDPKNRSVLGEAGIPLVVSGHTHGGQFFPGTLMVRILYKEMTRGLISHVNGSYYTTTGVGTAVSPARVETDAEIVILES